MSDVVIELVGVRNYNRYLVLFPISYRYFDPMIGFVVRLVLGDGVVAVSAMAHWSRAFCFSVN